MGIGFAGRCRGRTILNRRSAVGPIVRGLAVSSWRQGLAIEHAILAEAPLPFSVGSSVAADRAFSGSIAMALPRFYVDVPLAVGLPATLPHAATRHALRVLRVRQGEMITLFNGQGGEYDAQLIGAREPEAEVQIVRFDPREAESPWSFTVAQGLSSGDRMDWTVEKSVELGAATIAPLATARSVTRLAGDRAKSRRAHWQALAIAASAQCGRNRIATVDEPMPIDAWFATQPPAATRLLLAPGGAPLRTVRRPEPGGRVVVLAGPEGGLDASESTAAVAAGFLPVALGPRILRTETAAAVALAMLSALWDEGSTNA
jgi:16S rRNA (uracil1498-N3)-methyltransferase